MKRTLKKLILSISVILVMLFMSINVFGTICESGNEHSVPAEITDYDYASSTSKVYFQKIDATNVQYIEIPKSYVNRSIWATTPGAPSIVNGNGTGTFGSNGMIWGLGSTSRLIVTKAFKVNPAKRFTIVIANNGDKPKTAKVCVGQFSSSLRFIDDGNWATSSQTVNFYNNATLTVRTTGQKVYNCTTQWIVPVLRFDNGDNAVGSGQDTSIGWGFNYTLDLNKYHTYYVFDSFKYTKNLNGGGNTTVVERWGIGNVSSSFNAPTRTGYTFKGWRITDKNGNVIKIVGENNNVIKSCDCITAAELNAYNCLDDTKFYTNFFQDLTFTAQWAGNGYTNTLYYNANGGSGAPSAQTKGVSYPNTASTFNVSTTVPVRAGYTKY